MNALKPLFLAAAVLAAPVVFAQHAGHGSHAAPAAGSSAAASSASMTEGEVRRIDKQAGKLTLRHGEIRNLDMPPMTMVFGLREPKLLEGLKPGDKVRFSAVQEGGDYIVTGLEVVR